VKYVSFLPPADTLIRAFPGWLYLFGEITCQGTTSVVPKRLDENQFLAAAGRRATKRSARKRGYTNIETGLVVP